MNLLVGLVFGLLLGGLAGAYLRNAYLTKAPGLAVQLHEQALVKRWQAEPWWVQWPARLQRRPGGAAVVADTSTGGDRGYDRLAVRNGPAWLTGMDRIFLVGVYDVSDKRFEILVEPVYAPVTLPLDDPPSFQRFFVQLVVVYRPHDMRKVFSIEDDIDELITARTRYAVRSRATQTAWQPLDDGSAYADAVRDTLAAALGGRGIEVIEVFCERIGVRAQPYLDSMVTGTRARNMGDEGLVLTYLEVLEKLAASESTTIVIPADLGGDPRTVLQEALRRSGADGATGAQLSRP